MSLNPGELGSLAPIVVVMPVVAWQLEALARHLNGKRGALLQIVLLFRY